MFKRTPLWILAALLLLGFSRLAQAQSVTTDKSDYAPGSTVRITGSGWHASETVTLQVVHTDTTADIGDPDHQPWTVTTDSSGNFTATWAVDAADVAGSSFVLYADDMHPTDSNDTTPHLHAEAYFTDSPKVVGLSVGSQSSPGFVAANGTATYTVTITGNGSQFDATLSMAGLGNSAQASFNPATVSFLQGDTTKTSTLTITTAGAPTGSTSFTVTAMRGNNDAASGNGTLAVDATPPTTTASSSPSKNAGNFTNLDTAVTLTATDSGGAGASSVTYRVDGGGAQTYSGPFIISSEGPHTVSFHATDAVGNVESPDKTFTFTLDKTAPTTTAMASPAPTASGWNNSDVSVTLSSSDSISGVANSFYYLGGAQNAGSSTAPVTYTAGISITTTGTTTVHYWSKDNAGNAEAEKQLTIKLDKVAPTVNLGSPADNAFVRGTTNLTATASDSDSGIAKVEFYVDSALKGTVASASASYSLDTSTLTDGSHAWLAKAYDVAGNSTPTTSRTIKVDNTPPTTTATPDHAPNVAGWNNTSVTVTISASDGSGSGVASITYSLDSSGGSVSQPSTTVVVSGEGSHTLTYHATDNAGNVEAGHTLTIKIDQTAPVTTATQSPSPNGNGWNNTDVTVTLSVTDAGGSNVKSTTYTVDGGLPLPYAAPFAISAEGVHSVHFSSVDNAGNTESDKSITVQIDKTTPTPGISIAPTPNVMGWNNTDVNVTVTGTDLLSQVASLAYSINGGTATTTSGASATFPIHGDGTVSVGYSATDKAGNASAMLNASVKIDTVKPATTYALSQQPTTYGWNNQDVTVTLNATDNPNGSGVAGITYTINTNGTPGSPITVSSPAVLPVISTEGTTTINYYATDIAGNVEDQHTLTVMLDKTPPTLSFGAQNPAANQYGWNNAAVSVPYTASDTLSGLDPLTPTGTLTFSSEGANQAVTVTVRDKAGNVTTLTRPQPVNIDMTPPVISGADENDPVWHNTTQTRTYTVSDPLSGLLNGADASITLTASAESTMNGGGVVPTSDSRVVYDKAGNSATRSFSALIDKTPPVITPGAVHGNAGDNGWYLSDVSVDFTASDALSGLKVAGDASFTLNANEEGTAVALGSKTIYDQAGNAATSAPRTFKIDKTNPDVQPGDLIGGSNWYNAAVTQHFTASDTPSGLANPADASFDLIAASESANANTPTVVSRTVKDNAGRTTVRTVSALIDLTPPVIIQIGSIQGTLGNLDGTTQWYKSDVSVNYSASDALSGLKVPADALFALTTNGEGLSVALPAKSVLDNAGNSAQPPVQSFAVDKTAPLVCVTPDRKANNAGWYNSPVTFTTTATDATSGVASVDPNQTYSGPDSATGTVTGHAADSAGNVGSKTKSFGYDATPPAVTIDGVSDDPAHKSYLHNASITASLSDNLSGIANSVALLSLRTAKGLWYNYPADQAQFQTIGMPSPLVLDPEHGFGAEGNYTLVIIATDAAGNVTQEIRQFTIDATAPIIHFLSPTPDEGSFHKDQQQVVYDYSDALDPQPYLTVQELVTSNGSGDILTDPFASDTWVSAEGRHKVNVTASDHANNTSSSSRSFTIDITPPATVASVQGSPAPNADWYETLEALALTATDPPVQPANVSPTYKDGFPGSGVKNLTFSINGVLQPIVPGASKPFDVSTIQEGDYIIVFHAADNAGNVELDRTLHLMFDHTPPTIAGTPGDVTLEATSPQGAPYTFNITASDNVALDTLGTDHASGDVFPLDQTTPVTATAKDKAGHITHTQFAVTVHDTTPPTISNVPADITAEATGPNGAPVTFSMPTASDIVDGTVTVTADHQPGCTFHLGTTTVTFTAVDAHGNTAHASFDVTVRDTTPPSITPPGDKTVEATGPSGAAVNFTVPPATDLVDGTDPVIAAPASGSTFAITTTTVQLSSTDNAGNKATSAFKVKVQDTTPPVINNVPANIVAEATSAAGASVIYSMPTATDIVDGNVTVATDHPSGSNFALGATTVHLTATDAHGNKACASFNVMVHDTTPPTINAPGNQVVEATSNGGAAVTFTATATDLVDGPVQVQFDHQPGSTFPLGITTVNCSATDAHNNTATATFTVTVQDTTPPTIDPESDITKEATGPNGAIVTFNVTANDTVDGAVGVTSSPASGSTFGVGVTTVTNTASDAHGNKATSTFKVTVQDTTPPTITVPSLIAAEATGPNGATVTFAVSATDIVDGAVSVQTDHNSGDMFPLGATTVTCTATDAHGNKATASFTVTVQDTTTPTITAPADITAEATGVGGATVSFSASATDLVDGSVAVNASPSSGSMFPLGDTTVNLTATDAHGNKATASFKVSVKDTTPPSISSIVDVSAEATGPNGAKVTFGATATDLVDGPVTVTFAPASGSTFALGDTTVSATASDSHGNSATKTFKVTVKDTTPPQITAHAPAAAEATGPTGATVTFTPPTATDLVDGTVAVKCAPASGSTFPLGTTTVVCTATDAHGNTATSQFQVTVKDTTPPTLTVPATITAVATSASGAVVTFTASAADLVDGTDAVVSTPASGSLFPLGSTTVKCTATDSKGNAGTGSFLVNVIYSWSGVLQPINADGTSIFKLGSTVPVKFQLTGASSGITNAVAKLSVAKYSNSVLGSYVEATSTSAADSGNQFRYDPTSNQYIFNLSTKSLSTGTWELKIDLGDGNPQYVMISLK